MSIHSRTIEMYRMLAEDQLAYLLEDAESAVTIHNVKSLIFEADTSDFHAYLKAMLSAIDREDIDRIDDEEIQVIQDAWNYFPHRALGGKCPAEIMAEQLRRRRT